MAGIFETIKDAREEIYNRILADEVEAFIETMPDMERICVTWMLIEGLAPAQVQARFLKEHSLQVSANEITSAGFRGKLALDKWLNASSAGRNFRIDEICKDEAQAIAYATSLKEKAHEERSPARIAARANEGDPGVEPGASKEVLPGAKKKGSRSK